MSESWLDALPAHPIFELPAEPERSRSLSTHPSLSELARPPSPALSSIFPRASSKGSDRKDDERDHAGGRRARVVLARGVDLIVAVGRELRIASLNDLKARADGRGKHGPDDRDVGEYKTLHTPLITFDIQQLVLNSTSKLLAVVGLHSVAVVVLPRKGWSGSIGSSLDCRSLLVGRFYHALPASPAVAQVGWHPWGDNASSLLVLTADATLREYAIGDDAEEPAQTVSLAAPGLPRGFSADDADERTAVAFALGHGDADWGPLTLYGLMRSGDVVALCPFLPKKATVPTAYIHALSTFVSTKVDRLGAREPDNPLALVASRGGARSSPGPSPLVTLRYTHQLQYIASLVHQASSFGVLRPVDGPPDADAVVRILAPRHPAQPTRQGPFLLQPAPLELANGLSNAACDLAYVPAASPGGPAVFALAYADGKVDFCIEADRVEARWGTQDARDAPTLVVFEAIDLGLADAAVKVEDLEDNYPVFERDPKYSDVLYVYHALGAHCLVMARWLDAVAGALDEDDDEAQERAVERTLRAQEPTEVLWVLRTDSPARPVVGLALSVDAYLGYSLLVLTSSLQLVALALSLRVSASLLPSSSPLPPSRLSSDPPAYLSLLDTPFSLPPLFASQSSLPPVPRLAPTSSPLTITPSSLRSLAQTVSDFRLRIRALVAAADVVQGRLELQMKELSRQLLKLRELSSLSASLRASTGSEGLGGRLKAVGERQQRLLERTDRVLQRLMDDHAPVLSAYETRWFEELGRLEREIRGAGGGESLQRRMERAGAMLESLEPVLEEMRGREEGSAPTNGAPQVMGDSQVRRLELKLAEEAKLITEARRRLDRLTSTLAATALSAP